VAAEVGDARADVTRNRPGNGPRATGNYNAPMKRLLLALAVLAATSASAKIDFVEDDYATAMARAKTKNVPVFVEAWAPW
jgi:hypothetical protein